MSEERTTDFDYKRINKRYSGVSIGEETSERSPMLFENLKWMTKESLLLLTSFGKDLIKVDTSTLQFNTIHNPVAYKYYEKGDWSFEF